MLYAFATTPSLRDTSPQGEAFCMAPIEGSCRHSRLWGGFLMLYAFATTPSLRDHLSSRKGFCMAPIEGSCRRLWGGFLI